jgi:protein TonB
MTVAAYFNMMHRLRAHLSVVALVVLLHAGVGLAWVMRPSDPSLVLNEMTVSIAMQQADIVQTTSTPKPLPPKPKPKAEEEIAPTKVESKVTEVPPLAPALPEVAAEAAALVVDAEPDYRADYLNNPRPAYPMVARRMGYRGKVLLNVEVMSEGKAGQVLIYASSGHAVLDNSALQVVRSWRFVPARQAGRAITKWFIVPISFSLEGNEA